jgi:deferrochelatase/peroxidase EfeB
MHSASFEPGELVSSFARTARSLRMTIGAIAAAGSEGHLCGLSQISVAVGAFNRFLRANGSTEEEQELIAAKLVGRRRSGAPLVLAPDVDDPALGADPHQKNDVDYSNNPRGRSAPLGCHIRRTDSCCGDMFPQNPAAFRLLADLFTTAGSGLSS